MIKDDPHIGNVYTYGANGTHCFGAVRYTSIMVPTNTYDANGQLVVVYKEEIIANATTSYSADYGSVNVAEIDLSPGVISIYAANATLNNISVWSANSILTRSYADTRYAAFSATIDGGSATTTGTGSYDGGSATTN